MYVTVTSISMCGVILGLTSEGPDACLLSDLCRRRLENVENVMKPVPLFGTLTGMLLDLKFVLATPCKLCLVRRDLLS